MGPKLARRNEPEYYLRLTAEDPEEGPFPIEVLREKARAGEIAPETWFRVDDATEYRQLDEDGPLVADLWPEDEAFDPEKSFAAPVPAVSDPNELGHGDGDVAGLLGDNVERDRAARLASGEAAPPRFDWKSLFALKWVALRWILASFFAVIGVGLWTAGLNPVTFFFGVLLIALVVFLTLPETVPVVIAPLTGLFGTLLEGSGGGKTADYWTADSLLDQGEYRLAAAEYRRIALEHPTELKAYLNGIRASRAFDNQKEADRFRDLALKNFKTEQDRNLFLSSLERMD